MCINQLITIEVDDYEKTVYPFCLFQYLSTNALNEISWANLPYKIFFTKNIQRNVLHGNSSINYYTSHC